MSEIKVSYRLRDMEFFSKAYIDEETGLGTDKHTDIPVQLEWREVGGSGWWQQVDDWEWLYLWDGSFIPAPSLIEKSKIDQVYARTQPKRLSRRQRRKL